MRIFIFGASTTYGVGDPEGGWATRIRKWIDEKGEPDKHRIYNLGIPGDTSSDLLERFENEVNARVRKKAENIFIISVGANDSQWFTKEEKHRVPPDQYEKNMRLLFQKAQKHGNKLFFVGFAPLDESKVDPIPWAPEKSYKNEFVQQYDQIVKKVCEEMSVVYIELFSHMDEKDILDGVHPTAEGHKKIFEQVKNVLVSRGIH